MLFLGLLAVAFSLQAQSGPVVTVHEWGTFTCLQDEQGQEIVGINADDELLPKFVHRLKWDGSQSRDGKGAPRCHPDVTMRLETPVTYFHPPLNTTETLVVNVTVEFHGGLLTEYYPYATTSVDSRTTDSVPARTPITASTTGAISWQGVRIGDQAEPLETSSPVWLAPRAVGSAATLKVYKPGPPGSKPDDEGTTEGEVYLFYRGVAHLESPVRVERTVGTGLKISLRHTAQPFHVASAWLLDVKHDGAASFRHIGQMDSRSSHTNHQTEFPAGGYSSGATGELQSQMREALNAEGLFDDEAAAMLKTWELSYFRSPGLRLFYLLPQQWTDKVLPLKIDGPARIAHRIMMGRVELVTAEQRTLVQQIATRASTRDKIANLPLLENFNQLGRFGNAIVLDELRRRPTEPLRAFVQQFNLQSAFDQP